jgi:glycine cleavage system H protein
MYPEEFRYTKDHEWAEPESSNVRIGITEYAQEQLGDIVFVDLPNVGDSFKQGDVLGSVESVKAVSDLYCPISGEVVQVNELLDNEPELVNSDPHGEGWMVILKMTNPPDLEGLLTVEEYEEHLREEEEAELDDNDDDDEEEDDDEQYDKDDENVSPDGDDEEDF